MSRSTYWQTIYQGFFRRFEKSNLSIIDFCNKEHISTKAFYYRRKKLREMTSPRQDETKSLQRKRIQFAPVELIDAIPSPNNQSFEIVFPDKKRLTIPSRFDPVMAAELITLLSRKEPQCSG